MDLQIRFLNLRDHIAISFVPQASHIVYTLSLSLLSRGYCLTLEMWECQQDFLLTMKGPQQIRCSCFEDTQKKSCIEDNILLMILVH